MDYFSLGDSIGYSDLNALVYLLRKFKRLTSNLSLGDSSIVSDYGSFNITGGLESVGGNFIIESPVTISSSDVLKNCFYSFVFNVIDVNLSGTVNKRTVKVTGDTGDNGLLSVTLPTSLIESDEVLLPEFTLDIVFDPHEYYTPVSGLDITLESDKSYVVSGESATITATVCDDEGNPLEDFVLGFSVNGSVVTETTDSDGEASISYVSTGEYAKVTIIAGSERLILFDTPMTATVTGNSITLGIDPNVIWLGSNGSVVIDWGDGTTSTVNNPRTQLSHSYTDSLSSHDILFVGDITSLGNYCFTECTGLTSISIPSSVTSLGNGCFTECTGLTSISIPSSVTSLGNGCFNYCTGLTSVTIPDSVTSIGDSCFWWCTALVDYQLYWLTPPKNWNNDDMPNNTNTIFTIPLDKTATYIAKNYPGSKLVERGSTKTTTLLSLTSSTSSITVGESVTLTGTLTDNSNNPVTNASVKIYQGDTLLDTLTTDNNGEVDKTVSGLTAGSYNFKAVYDGDSTYKNSESSIITVTVTAPVISLAVTGSPIIETSNTNTITATLLADSTPVEDETLSYTVKHGATVITTGSDTTDNNGEISISYTGTGIGEITVTVTYDNLQETYTFYDVLKYDNGKTPSDYHDIWSVTTGATFTRGATGTTLAETDNTNVAASTSISANTIIDFEIYQTDGGTNRAFAHISQTSTARTTVMLNNVASSPAVQTWYKVRLIVTSDTLRIINRDTWDYVDKPISDTFNSIRLVTGNEITGLMFRNVMFYEYDGGDLHDYDLDLTCSTPVIQSGGSASVVATLTADNVGISDEVLSYTVKHGSTTLATGSDTTDSNGQITIAYTGTGVGDVDITVDYGILLQEIFVLEDLVYYNTNEYSSQASLNISLPSTFTIEFDVKPTSRTNASAFVGLGTSTTNELIVGQMTSAGSCGVRNRTNNSYTTQQAFTTSSTLNSDNHFKLTFDGTDWIAYYGSETLTNSKPSAYDLSKLVEVYPTLNCKLKNIKVKAL